MLEDRPCGPTREYDVARGSADVQGRPQDQSPDAATVSPPLPRVLRSSDAGDSLP